MTLHDFLVESYGWADGHSGLLFLVALVLPVVGTLLAWIGRAGKTDADGKFIASAVIGVAILAVTVELCALLVGRVAMGASLMDANATLLLAPVLCLGGSVMGIRSVFPLSSLGSVRTAVDLGAFVLALLGVAWLFSMFRGWSVVFFGSFTQLVVVGVLGFLLIWRLYRRAFGLGRTNAGGAR